jgi:poly(hydroxyalkanoate) depolymerase family esterase
LRPGSRGCRGPSGCSALASQKTFIAVYPELDPAANPLRCWNWFDPANQARDQGEPGLIAGITRQVIASYSIDPDRVFVIGASAGGAMSVILGATYPDLFAAIAVVAGCEFGGEPCGQLPSPDPSTRDAPPTRPWEVGRARCRCRSSTAMPTR